MYLYPLPPSELGYINLTKLNSYFVPIYSFNTTYVSIRSEMKGIDSLISFLISL